MLPGDEFMWVPPRAEVMARQAAAGRAAFQDFCYCGISHTGLGRRPLSPQQSKIYNLARVGWKPDQIKKRMNIPLASVYDALHKIKHNGWEY